jgi:hypothetical protein
MLDCIAGLRLSSPPPLAVRRPIVPVVVNDTAYHWAVPYGRIERETCLAFA